jgi:hypothetical protein
MDILQSLLWIAVLGSVLVGPLLVLRWMSDWTKLEELYRASDVGDRISRGSFRWVRSTFGWVRVGLCVDLYEEGVWMRMHFPANLITRPILLPWKAVRFRHLSTVLFARRVELSVDGYSKRIRFFGDPSGALIQELQRREPNNALQPTCEDARG